MSYQQGILNDANPAAAMMAILDAQIVAHPAWQFIEQVTSGAATARVYKNRGSVSHACPGDADFFVVISRDTDAGQVRFSLCESWDAVGKLLVRYAPANSGTAGAGTYQAIAADGSVGATGQAFTSANVFLAQPTDGLQVSTATPYYISVSPHRICYALRNQGWVYCGAYEPIAGAYEPFPIVLISQGYHGAWLGFGSNGDAAFRWYRPTGFTPSSPAQNGPGAVSTTMDMFCAVTTRQWRTATQAATSWVLRPYLYGTLKPWRLHGIPYWDQREPLTGRWYASKVALNDAHFSLNGATPAYDGFRGSLRDVWGIDPLDNYPSNGDIMVVEGIECVCMCRTPTTLPGDHFWVSKAA